VQQRALVPAPVPAVPGTEPVQAHQLNQANERGGILIEENKNLRETLRHYTINLGYPF